MEQPDWFSSWLKDFEEAAGELPIEVVVGPDAFRVVAEAARVDRRFTAELGRDAFQLAAGDGKWVTVRRRRD